MPDYFITGKKGNGKTLIATGKIKEYLERGLPVATNLNIWPEHLLSDSTKEMTLYRLPDKPDFEDMLLLPDANDTPDESLNGAIFLDEIGTWLNSRTFQDKSRLPFIDWLLHARKRGWDVFYMVQDLCQVDKQARESLAEHVVTCKRMDRIGIPLFGWLLNLVWGSKVNLPRVHVGVVHYLDQYAETWTYRGNHLFKAYDTKQIFRNDYPHKTFSYLPPFNVKGRFAAVRDKDFYMRLTKIHFRSKNKILLSAFSFLLGAVAIGSLFLFLPSGSSTTAVKYETTQANLSLLEFDGYRINSIVRFPGQIPKFTLVNSDDEKIYSHAVLADGYDFKIYSHSKLKIMKRGEYVTIYN